MPQMSAVKSRSAVSCGAKRPLASSTAATSALETGKNTNRPNNTAIVTTMVAIVASPPK